MGADAHRGTAAAAPGRHQPVRRRRVELPRPAPADALADSVLFKKNEEENEENDRRKKERVLHADPSFYILVMALPVLLHVSCGILVMALPVLLHISHGISVTAH